MEHMNEMTDQLLNILEAGRERFLNNEKPDNDRAFFNKVKKEADPVFSLLDEWTNNMRKLISENKLSLHPQQIDATKENMESFILHSYYIDTRKRRFIEIYKSCYYIFILSKEELS